MCSPLINSNVTSSTTNLNILPPVYSFILSHADWLSIFVFTFDLDQRSDVKACVGPLTRIVRAQSVGAAS
jgi:hypothetical protein